MVNFENFWMQKILKTVVGLSGRNDPFECKCPFSSRSYQTQDQFGQYHIVFNYICFFYLFYVYFTFRVYSVTFPHLSFRPF